MTKQWKQSNIEKTQFISLLKRESTIYSWKKFPQKVWKVANTSQTGLTFLNSCVSNYAAAIRSQIVLKFWYRKHFEQLQFEKLHCKMLNFERLHFEKLNFIQFHFEVWWVKFGLFLFQPISVEDHQTRKDTEINIENFKNFHARRRWKVYLSFSFYFVLFWSFFSSFKILLLTLFVLLVCPRFYVSLNIKIYLLLNLFTYDSLKPIQ